ncbi:TlpA family protein disulfide reductase [Psychroflexus aestuariivivens]|uniref:TlpA family protein disulfide reductase n=1 Tax=Psychroflexus aestuariivivens TaxID=1795040 RepID=UPI000FD8C84D|nr:TlpA disulfide reductase family protein [Psychroflexus aestuariivivens]
MLRIISTIFSILISFSLHAKSGKATISGQIENHTSSSIRISHLNNQKLVSAELDEQGNFKMTTKIEDGFYFLKYGRNTSLIYLYPKDKLDITFDAKDYKSTLTFNGKGATRNNYLVNKDKLESELTKDLEAFYKVNEEDFLKNIQEIKKVHLSALSEYEVEKIFKTAEKKSLEYNRLLSIQNYESNYKFYLGEEITVSKDFTNPIKSLDLKNKEDYKKQPYYRYLVNSVWSERIDEAKDVGGMLNVLRNIKSQDLLVSLVNGAYSKISSNKERAKDYLDLIKQVTTHELFIERAEKKYQETVRFESLKKGNISPEFSYENVNGEIISLKDLKGKYVYIDVWATWCAPCLKQIPYLKKLEHTYKDNNIVFVSISVDKKEVKKTWKQTIKDKKLTGIQLFADKSFDSDFMNAYAVNSIPRFILIDPKGKIINPEAPRPSFEKTKTLLDQLLK